MGRRKSDNINVPEEDQRPWGYYRVLADEPDHKVKSICVYPGERLSLQRHRCRSEHWYIVEGTALVVVDANEIYLKAGDSIDISMGSAHRIMNAGEGNLVFIEVQRGGYFGEDDIERLQDDYGRVP
jgi:mannose-6-phosphate isomerase-like protein (cupin superfamily)